MLLPGLPPGNLTRLPQIIRSIPMPFLFKVSNEVATLVPHADGGLDVLAASNVPGIISQHRNYCFCDILENMLNL